MVRRLNLYRTLTLAFFSMALLLFTGCAKEEVVAPAAAVHGVKSGEAAPGTGSVVGTDNGSGDGVDITDDGDDLGDKERSNKPH